MGQTSGSASGSAGSMSAQQQGGMQGGMAMVNAGGQQQQSQDQILTQLARMGPPPAMNTAGAPPVGQDIVGKYGANMKPPQTNYRTRQDVQMNPSVGQLLAGRA